MKRVLLLLCLLPASFFAFSQTKAGANNTPEYIRTPTIPDFTVYTAPDSSAFTNNNLQKNKPTLLMIFSPECGHCQNVTREMENYMGHFKNTQILMVTWLPYTEMMAFYHNYKIAEYPQITLGWDKKDFFLPYYHVQMYPGIVVYNKHGKYVTSFNGDVKMEDVAKALGE